MRRESLLVLLRSPRRVELALVHPDDLLTGAPQERLSLSVRVQEDAGICVGNKRGVGQILEQMTILLLRILKALSSLKEGFRHRVDVPSQGRHLLRAGHTGREMQVPGRDGPDARPQRGQGPRH